MCYIEYENTWRLDKTKYILRGFRCEPEPFFWHIGWIQKTNGNYHIKYDLVLIKRISHLDA